MHNNKDIKLKLIFVKAIMQTIFVHLQQNIFWQLISKGNLRQIQQALDDWYLANNKNYKAFDAKYPLYGELKEEEKQIAAMDIGCKEAGITGTTTFFINRNRMPENYNINELIFAFPSRCVLSAQAQRGRLTHSTVIQHKIVLIKRKKFV